MNDELELALWACYDCCVELVKKADEEGLLIGVGREHPDQQRGPGERRMRRAIARVQAHADEEQ